MKLRIPRIIRRDLLRKLIAIFFALVIWLAISAQMRETSVLSNVEVTLDFDPTETIVQSGIPTVNVTVRGSPRALEPLKSSDIRLVAVVPEVTPGIHYCDIGISRRNVTHTPPGIRVVSLSKQKIQVKVDRKETRANVPVTVRFEGKVREGYRKTRCIVTPNAINLRGAHLLVKDIREVTTETIMLDDTMMQDFSMDVGLSTVDGVEMPRSVRVEVWVAQAGGRSSYTDLPVSILTAPAYQLEVVGQLPHISLGVHGPENALSQLTPEQIHPFVDLSTIKAPGQHTCPIQVWVDGDTSLLVQNINPAKISIELAIVAARPKPTPAPKPAAPEQKKPAKPTPTPKPAAPEQKKPAKPAAKPDAPK